MNLFDKLNLYQSTAAPVKKEPSILTDADAKAIVQDAKTEDASASSVLDPLCGRVVSNLHGQFYQVEKEYPLSYIYGTEDLGALIRAREHPFLKLLPKTVPHPDLKKFLFLDTETTGLSGGTGTVAFLIGVGFFTDSAFVLRQYLMRDYDEEAAMLYDIGEKMKGFDAMVTFNGKAFDLHLLKTRFIANRFRCKPPDALHLDLLYPARILWKQLLGSCRLIVLEEHILKAPRLDDIPGSLIPEIYFRYLDTHDTADMIKVLSHNERDILALVSLLEKVNRILLPPTAGHSRLELLGAARIHEKLDLMEDAKNFYQHAILGEPCSLSRDAARRLCMIYKKMGQYEKAQLLMEKVCVEQNSLLVSDWIELAKLYEHREKNYATAKAAVENALKCQRALSLHPTELLGLLKKRLARIDGKLSRWSS